MYCCCICCGGGWYCWVVAGPAYWAWVLSGCVMCSGKFVVPFGLTSNIPKSVLSRTFLSSICCSVLSLVNFERIIVRLRDGVRFGFFFKICSTVSTDTWESCSNHFVSAIVGTYGDAKTDIGVCTPLSLGPPRLLLKRATSPMNWDITLFSITDLSSSSSLSRALFTLFIFCSFAQVAVTSVGCPSNCISGSIIPANA